MKVNIRTMHQDLEALKQGKPLTFVPREIHISESSQKEKPATGPRSLVKPEVKTTVSSAVQMHPTPLTETPTIPAPKIEKLKHPTDKTTKEQVVINADKAKTSFFMPKDRAHKPFSLSMIFKRKKAAPKTLPQPATKPAEQSQTKETKAAQEKNFLKARVNTLLSEAKTLYKNKMYQEAGERIKEISDIKPLNLRAKLLRWRIKRKLNKKQKQKLPKPTKPPTKPAGKQQPCQKKVSPPPSLPTAPTPPQKKATTPLTLSKPSADRPASAPKINQVSKQTPAKPLHLPSNITDKKPKRKPSKKIVIIVGSAIIVLIAASVGFLWFGRSPKTPTPKPPITITPPTPLLIGDDNITIQINNTDALLNEISRVFNEKKETGKLYNVFIKLNGNNPKYLSTFSEITSAMRLTIPADITDKIKEQATLMLYAQQATSSSPFIAGYGQNRLAIITQMKEMNVQQPLENALKNWQNTLVADLKNLSYGRTFNATDKKFNNTERRNAKITYINLPRPILSFDYIILHDYLMFTTSKESTDTLIGLVNTNYSTDE